MTGTNEVSYTGENGKAITFSADHVVKVFAQGGAEPTVREVAIFMRMCEYHQLNPFVGEAYLIKYGKPDATMVVSKDVHQRRAAAHPQYDGQEAGIVLHQETSDTVKRTTGSIVLPGWTLIGGWAIVYRKDRSHPAELEVGLAEYLGKKSDGSTNSMWKSKPGTMIRKVALAQALRESFPDVFQQLYADEEITPVVEPEEGMRDVTPTTGTEDVREKVLEGMKDTFSQKAAGAGLLDGQVDDMNTMMNDIQPSNPRCLEDMAALSALLETAIAELPKEPVVEKPKVEKKKTGKKPEEDDGAVSLTEVLMNEIREVMSDNIFEKEDRAGVDAKVEKIPADHPQVLQRLKKLRDSCTEERKRRVDEREKAEKEPAAEGTEDIPFEGEAPPEARTDSKPADDVEQGEIF